VKRTVETGLLLALLAFGFAALAGYATFGRHPSLLLGLPPSSRAVYAAAYSVFSQGHIWLSAGVLAIWLVAQAGWRWLPALGAVYTVSLGSELAGTTWGLPFGLYAYDAALGPAWLGRVPWIIPLSWFLMAVPSYAIARWTYPGAGGATWKRIGLGSVVLLSWDLALDPAMSYATRYWRWAEIGPYYGMPLTNLFGWYVTGLALMAVFVALRADRWIERLSVRWLVAYYGANLILPLGMCAAAGLGWAVVATVAALLGAGAWVRLASGRPEAIAGYRGARPEVAR
jgi:putative membrane protein